MRIYIAGPLNHGSEQEKENISKALSMAQRLIIKGHTPFVPHLYAHLADEYPILDEKTMLALVMSFLPVCDAVLRLPGTSPGADKEVQRALALKMPVFYNFDEVPKGTPR